MGQVTSTRTRAITSINNMVGVTADKNITWNFEKRVKSFSVYSWLRIRNNNRLSKTVVNEI